MQLLAAPAQPPALSLLAQRAPAPAHAEQPHSESPDRAVVSVVYRSVRNYLAACWRRRACLLRVDCSLEAGGRVLHACVFEF